MLFSENILSRTVRLVDPRDYDASSQGFSHMVAHMHDETFAALYPTKAAFYAEYLIAYSNPALNYHPFDPKMLAQPPENQVALTPNNFDELLRLPSGMLIKECTVDGKAEKHVCKFDSSDLYVAFLALSENGIAGPYSCTAEIVCAARNLDGLNSFTSYFAPDQSLVSELRAYVPTPGFHNVSI